MDMRLLLNRCDIAKSDTEISSTIKGLLDSIPPDIRENIIAIVPAVPSKYLPISKLINISNDLLQTVNAFPCHRNSGYIHVCDDNILGAINAANPHKHITFTALIHSPDAGFYDYDAYDDYEYPEDHHDDRPTFHDEKLTALAEVQASYVAQSKGKIKVAEATVSELIFAHMLYCMNSESPYDSILDTFYATTIQHPRDQEWQLRINTYNDPRIGIEDGIALQWNTHFNAANERSRLHLSISKKRNK